MVYRSSRGPIIAYPLRPFRNPVPKRENCTPTPYVFSIQQADSNLMIHYAIVNTIQAYRYRSTLCPRLAN